MRTQEKPESGPPQKAGPTRATQEHSQEWLCHGTQEHRLKPMLLNPTRGFWGLGRSGLGLRLVERLGLPRCLGRGRGRPWLRFVIFVRALGSPLLRDQEWLEILLGRLL